MSTPVGIDKTDIQKLLLELLDDDAQTVHPQNTTTIKTPMTVSHIYNNHQRKCKYRSRTPKTNHNATKLSPINFYSVLYSPYNSKRAKSADTSLHYPSKTANLFNNYQRLTKYKINLQQDITYQYSRKLNTKNSITSQKLRKFNNNDVNDCMYRENTTIGRKKKKGTLSTTILIIDPTIRVQKRNILPTRSGREQHVNKFLV
ncbi:unnamed protein product [Didymodactylos carnosus]|uniref:Uncharacterized protein n=1 Tax=Didymodactylos carnosus TaxID=1234261 RepID=A0A8S2DT33_9BILA|nr:unnamed protein product [Didymodactylos carnosus]CAF3745040.1 unnamed protein product [Didymodactylos carnosus]